MINLVRTLGWFGRKQGEQNFANSSRRSAGLTRAGGPGARLLVAWFLVVQIMFASIAATAVIASTTEKKAVQSGAVLVMVEETGCPYCARWHREIGSIYAKTPEGRFAPLKTVFIHEKQAQAYKRVVYTPTFIVMHKGKEVGRILGYTGENFFWPMLEELLKKAGYNPEQSSAVTQ